MTLRMRFSASKSEGLRVLSGNPLAAAAEAMGKSCQACTARLPGGSCSSEPPPVHARRFRLKRQGLPSCSRPLPSVLAASALIFIFGSREGRRRVRRTSRLISPTRREVARGRSRRDRSPRTCPACRASIQSLMCGRLDIKTPTTSREEALFSRSGRQGVGTGPSTVTLAKRLSDTIVSLHAYRTRDHVEAQGDRIAQ